MTDAASSTRHGPPEIGDDVELADALSAGDIVYFDRVGPSRVLVHAVTKEVLQAFSGPLFILELGNCPSSARFRPVSRDDLE